MKSKAGLFLEYLWLLISVISLSSGIYQWYNGSLKNASIFFIMVVVSLLMYNFRRHLRNKQDKQEE